MDDLIKSYEIKNHKINVFYDQSSDSPRDWDNQGKMLLLHRDYDLAFEDNSLDKEDTDQIQSFMDKVLSSGGVVLPVYMYEHGNIALSTKRDYPFNCLWDSSFIGFIYCEKKNFEGLKKSQVEKNLVSEVKTYSQFLSGQVYGFSIEKKETCKVCKKEDSDLIDSCWGFYDIDESLIEFCSETLSEKEIKELKNQL